MGGSAEVGSQGVGGWVEGSQGVGGSVEGSQGDIGLHAAGRRRTPSGSLAYTQTTV